MRDTIRAITGPADPNGLPSPRSRRRRRDPDEPVISFRDVHLLSTVRSSGRQLRPRPRHDEDRARRLGVGQDHDPFVSSSSGCSKPDAGSIDVDGIEVSGLGEEDLLPVRLKIGMVFQEGALFDSLTVGENVGYRLAEDGQMAEKEIEERVR
jgi:phospholipid/cholesterol/gamma-HCH transport system ATP-binding protein